MDTKTLDRQISEAINAHSAWRKTLCDGAKTGILPKPAAKIACNDDCPFGHWLEGIKKDPAVSTSPEFQRVYDKHTLFHVFAGEVATLIEAGDKSAAIAELEKPQISSRSYALLDAILAWQKSVTGEAYAAP